VAGAATTGLRRGELVGLRWPDVDFHAGRIAVVQQRAKGGGTVAVGPTKTKRSRRLVSLDAGTIAALRQHREAQDKEKELLGAAYGDEDLVFCRPDGSALHPDRVTQLFRGHVRRAGLPRIKLHGLRHSHATLMLRAGVHPRSSRNGSAIRASPSPWTPTATPYPRCRRTPLAGWPGSSTRRRPMSTTDARPATPAVKSPRSKGVCAGMDAVSFGDSSPGALGDVLRRVPGGGTQRHPKSGTCGAVCERTVSDLRTGPREQTGKAA